MGKVYDALLRTDAADCEDVPPVEGARAPSAGRAKREQGPPTPVRPARLSELITGPIRELAAEAEAPGSADGEILERLASLEVAVYALLDRLEAETDARPLRRWPGNRTGRRG